MDIQEIKKYMKERKISYEKLAEMTGLSVSTITKIFGGFAKYPRVDTMETIERALGLDDMAPALQSLTEEQKNLLALFDGMTPDQRGRLFAFCEGMLAEAAGSAQARKKS